MVEVPIIHLRSAVITERRDARVCTEKGPLGPHEWTLHAALMDREGAWISRAGVGVCGEPGRARKHLQYHHPPAGPRKASASYRSGCPAGQRARRGIVVVEGEKVAFELPLPVTGMMSGLPFGDASSR